MDENVIERMRNERMICCSVRGIGTDFTGVVKDSRTERMPGVRTGRGRKGEKWQKN